MVPNAYGGVLLDNPPTVGGAISGVVIALTAAAIARSKATRRLPAIFLGALLGGAAGKVVQRWTWSDARVREQLLEAEHALEV